MRATVLVSLLLAVAAGVLSPAQAAIDCAASDINVKATRLLGGEENLCERYGGKVLLVVNVASKCGFTKQYEGLEQLYRSHAPDGLVILGFPSDQFMGQEYGDDAEIARFCKLNFGVTFPMFSRGDVKGEGAHPLYQRLRARTGEAPSWNFNKYLVGRDGKVIAHFGSTVKPTDTVLVNAVRQALQRPAT